MTALGELAAAEIGAQGPMRLDRYMALCLGHPKLGYYRTRDPLGRDFTTAPEISQMFGELVGAWVAQVWRDLGAPAPFVLAELGPGRGTMMADVLRVASRVPGFSSAARLWLVETSPALRGAQAERLAVHRPGWVDRLEQLPGKGALILLANEFFDALPIRQFQRTDVLWRERVVTAVGTDLVLGWSAVRSEPELDARFPALGDGTIVETSPTGEAVAARVGARVGATGGAALICDYGAWDGTGDTLQAIRHGQSLDPLAAPGETDLTAHVSFRALAQAARPAASHGPVTQGEFLTRLGIAERAAALSRGKAEALAASIATAHRRLTHVAEMGHLFRVMSVTPDGAAPPPGFEPASGAGR